VAILDDFRSLEIAANEKRRTRKARRQEKGHREELRAFVDAASGGAADLQSPDSIFWSSALTLQVPLALGAGHAVRVDLPRALGGAGVEAASPLDTRLPPGQDDIPVYESSGKPAPR
jgi:hypothetical protein